jgi:hypothetical protein
MTTPLAKHRRLVYMISSPKGFLVDLWDGTPRWSCVAQAAVENSMAWLDLTIARQKCKECQMVLPHILLSLTLVELHKEGGTWRPVHQQGVEHD